MKGYESGMKVRKYESIKQWKSGMGGRGGMKVLKYEIMKVLKYERMVWVLLVLWKWYVSGT